MSLASLSPQPRHIQGIEEVAHLYEGFILDLWGVVHDGVSPFAGTLPALNELRYAKRKVWLLSNAPRRAAGVIEKLTAMGVTPDLYDGIVTSGEASWMALRDRYLEEWGRRIYHIGPPRDNNLYADLDAEHVEGLSEADFILNSGVVDFADSEAKYQRILEAGAKRGLPMLCANPDRVVHVQDQLVICAGTFADTYEKMGGTVVWYGKPHRTVYKMCLEGIGGGNIMAVGDSMLTDIAGATAAGIDSTLVLGGIHREALLESSGAPKSGNQMASFWEAYPYRPTCFSKSFNW